MNYRIEFHKQALKDYEKVKKNPNISKIVKRLLKIIEISPLKPPYEKLSGNLAGLYSRRINKQHRFVYIIDEERKLIRVLSLWTHYENII